MTASAIQPSTSQHLPLAQQGGFSTEQIDLIKQTVAAGTSDLELALFLEVAKSSGLNPFQRQIYAVMRNSRVQVNGKWEQQTKMVIQTGIDGYRLIASRSGVHLGTTDPDFGPVNAEGFPEYARVVVRKLVQGQVAEFPATARWSEYVQTKDEYAGGSKTGKKVPTEMWARMPHTMLGKCAEALALRKAFPAELSGVYSDVEMAQADNPAPTAPQSQSRRADVTREVAQAAGVQPQTTEPDPMDVRMRHYGPKLAARRERLKGYGVAHEAVTARLAELPDWRESDENAEAAMRNLEEWGAALKAQREQAAQQPQEAVPVQTAEAEVLASSAQRQALAQCAARAGATTSDDRAVLWGYLTSSDRPLGTKDLTEGQAQTILDMFSGWDNHEAAAVFVEAQKKILPF